MKILVYPHELSMGGVPINAVDLAAEMRDLGHDALVYAQRGLLEDYITEEKKLRFVPANEAQVRPAPQRIWELARLAKREQVDLIHAYEWPPCLDAYYGAHLFGGVPLMCTVLSMEFTPHVPTTVPLLIGTHVQADELRTWWPGWLDVMEPPIDVVKDHPDNDGTELRRQWGVGDDELLAVTVSRLDIALKLELLTDAIDAAGMLADRYPIRLMLVGDGDAATQLAERAAAVNQRIGREVVTLPGQLMDPRPAYAAADVVLGMGSSALRAMAHAKPLVVQGQRGFARAYDETSEPDFRRTGFYGCGTDEPGGPLVAAALGPLLSSPARRAELGAFGLRIVRERFSLRSTAERLLGIYEETIAAKRSLSASLRQAATIGGRAAAFEARYHLPAYKRRQRQEQQAKLAMAAGAVTSHS